MSEYIITIPDTDIDEDATTYYPDERHDPMPVERVVRCSDCKHYTDHEWILGTDVSDVCHFWHGEPTKVEPDGFCAWGDGGKR